MRRTLATLCVVAPTLLALPGTALAAPDDPVTITMNEPGAVVVPGASPPVTRTFKVCRPGHAGETFTVAGSARAQVVADTVAPLGEDGCSTFWARVSATDDGVATVTATMTADPVAATATFDVDKAAVRIGSVSRTGRMLTSDVSPANPLTVSGTADPGTEIVVLAVLEDGNDTTTKEVLGEATATGTGAWTVQATRLPTAGDHLRVQAVPKALTWTRDWLAYRSDAGLKTSRLPGAGALSADVSTTTTAFQGIGDPAQGITDLRPYDPRVPNHAFTKVGALVVERGAALGLTPTGTVEVTDTATGTTLARSYDVEAGVTLRRTYAFGADARHARITDRLENTAGGARTYTLRYVAGDGRYGSDDQEYSVEGGAWKKMADFGNDNAQTLASGGLAAHGYLQSRSNRSPGELPGHGHTFIVWHRAPASIVTVADQFDQAVLAYPVTVPAGGKVDIVHEAGMTAADSTAREAAVALAVPPVDPPAGPGPQDPGPGPGTGTGPGTTTPAPGTGTAPGTGGGQTTTPRDTLAPTVVASLNRTLKAAALSRSGFAVSTRCSERCTVLVDLVVSAKDARRLGLGSGRSLGRATKVLTAGKRTTVTVKLSARARRGLSRVRTLKANVRLQATDAAGNRTIDIGRLRVKR